MWAPFGVRCAGAQYANNFNISILWAQTYTHTCILKHVWACLLKQNMLKCGVWSVRHKWSATANCPDTYVCPYICMAVAWGECEGEKFEVDADAVRWYWHWSCWPQLCGTVCGSTHSIHRHKNTKTKNHTCQVCEQIISNGTLIPPKGVVNLISEEMTTKFGAFASILRLICAWQAGV